MNVKFEKTDDLNATLTITLSPADYQPSIEKELKDVQRKVSVPGFRPGKAPMGLVKKTYGRGVFMDEVNRLASKQLFDYLKENNIDVLGQPLLSTTHENKINFDTEEDFVFAFELGLVPDFKINISAEDVVTRYKIAVDDKMIEDEIKNLQKRHAEVSDVDTAEERDIIYATVTELDENNQPLEGGVADRQISLTADLVKNEELKNQLTGIGKEAELVVNIFDLFNDNVTVISSSLNIPKEAVNDLNKNFRMRVTEIKRYTDAEINQDLFNKIYGEGVVNNEAEFRNRVIEDLNFYYKNEAEHQLEHEISHLVTDKHNFELPDAFLKRWMLEQHSDSYTAENIDKKYDGEKGSLRYSLIRDRFEKEYGLEVNEDELEKASLGYTYNLFAQYGMYNPDHTTVKAFSDEQLKKADYRNRMSDIAINRALIAKVKEMVTIEEKEVTTEEFYAIIQQHNHAHHQHEEHSHEGHDHEGHDHDHDHDHEHEHQHSH